MTAHTRSWWQQPFAGFDLETTGVNTRTDRIVTANTTILTPGSPWTLEHTNLMFDPGIEIPPGATKVHGITTERVRAEGVPTPAILPVVVGTLADLFIAQTPVVVMNGSYDFTLLYHECRRWGVEPLDEQVGPSLVGPVIDVYVIDQQFDRYRKGPRKLADLCSHYGVKHDGAHDAQHDVVAAARVAYQQLRRYPQLRQMSAMQLHHAQVQWRAEQAARLQAHKRKTQPKAVVDPCWPMCTDPAHEG